MLNMQDATHCIFSRLPLKAATDIEYMIKPRHIVYILDICYFSRILYVRQGKSYCTALSWPEKSKTRDMIRGRWPELAPVAKMERSLVSLPWPTYRCSRAINLSGPCCHRGEFAEWVCYRILGAGGKAVELSSWTCGFAGSNMTVITNTEGYLTASWNRLSNELKTKEAID